MGGKLSRTKGAVGEREFFNYLSASLGITVTRNYASSSRGGHDTLGLVHGFAIEVKRAEVLKIPQWWHQTVSQAIAANGRPALAYRQSRQPWKVKVLMTDLMPGEGLPDMTIDLTRTAFIWVLKNWELQMSNSYHMRVTETL